MTSQYDHIMDDAESIKAAVEAETGLTLTITERYEGLIIGSPNVQGVHILVRRDFRADTFGNTRLTGKTRAQIEGFMVDKTRTYRPAKWTPKKLAQFAEAFREEYDYAKARQDRQRREQTNEKRAADKIRQAFGGYSAHHWESVPGGNVEANATKRGLKLSFSVTIDPDSITAEELAALFEQLRGMAE